MATANGELLGVGNVESETVRFLKLQEVVRRTGLKPDSIYRGGREGWFPRKVKVSERSSAWVESEVAQFIAKKIAERDATKSTQSAGAAA